MSVIICPPRASSRWSAGRRRSSSLGLSATVARKDGHHPIIFMQCGPVRHRVDAKAQAAARPFQHTVLVRPTSFRPLEAADPDVRIQFHDLYDELIADDERNRLICDEVVAGRSGRPLAAGVDGTQRASRLPGRSIVAEHSPPGRASRRHAAQGGSGDRRAPGGHSRERRARACWPPGDTSAKGFDDARLDTLFLTLPVSWRGTIAQYVGRLHRLHDRQARGARLRLRRPERAHAGPDVRSALPRL